MNSKCERWEDLPPELLAIIHGSLKHVADLVRFRWVCRSWRISAASLPHFPLKLPHPAIARRDLTIHANAVYLLRLRRDPSKAWMVSVQESVAGNLVLRHALTYEEIPIPRRFDLWSDDWVLTQVARSYSRNEICERCNGIERTKKVTIITNPCCGGTIQVVGWHRMKKPNFSEKAFFVLDLSGEARKIEWDGERIFKNDAEFVSFNGWTYTIDDIGNFYLVDHKKSRLLPIAEIGDDVGRFWLVVSDGDLYMAVIKHYASLSIYRLVIEDHTDGMITRGEWRKEVEDLGERVFFLANNCSFSVSARDLPRPWEGNCAVVDLSSGYVRCNCYPSLYDKGEGTVFFLGGQHPRRSRSMSSLEGYSDLFNPPSSWLD